MSKTTAGDVTQDMRSLSGTELEQVGGAGVVAHHVKHITLFGRTFHIGCHYDIKGPFGIRIHTPVPTPFVT